MYTQDILNRKDRRNGVQGALFLFVALILICGYVMWNLAWMPVVYYSQATGKPVAVEKMGRTQTVTPSTVLPKRHEKAWVP
jgi:hypothetical protein